MISLKFFIGDLERRAGLQPSKFMDRRKDDVSACQAGFINFIVSPLFALLKQYQPETKGLYEDNLRDNLAFWQLTTWKQDELKPRTE